MICMNGDDRLLIVALHFIHTVHQLLIILQVVLYTYLPIRKLPIRFSEFF